MSFGDSGLWGGGERYPFELARAMADIVPTRLLTFGREPSRHREGALEVVTLRTVGRWRGQVTNPIAPAFLREVRDARIVHAHHYRSLPTNLALLLAGRHRPVFCTDHGGGGRDLSWVPGLDRRLAGLLAVSRFSAAMFPRFSDRTTVIHGGVDPKRFRPGGSHEAGVLFVGRLLPHKGVDILIAALPPDTPLTVIGRAYDDRYLAHLQALAAGRTVRFVFDATDEQVAEAYRRAKVLVLPSVYRSPLGPVSSAPELLGLVLLEAMACGTPVVASAVGGTPEVVDEGKTGFMVAPGDESALAARVGEVLRDAGRWREMSAAGPEWVRQRFTWDSVARRCLAAYGVQAG
jgi:glycosyltransferase involved in cell wall biosynthesis